jgi:hypothetical protein
MAVDEPERDDAGGSGPDHVIIDPIDAVRILRASKAAKSHLVERFAGTGAPERDIIRELEFARPLAHPEQFEEAHRQAMYSIEVLDRNGARGAKLPRLGPLKPIAGALVSMITRWIVKGHQNSIVSRLSRLYARREAITERNSIEFHMLRRARFHARMVEDGYRSNTSSVPAFLVGGAIVSTVATTASEAVSSLLNTSHGDLVLIGVSTAIVASIAWIALFSAGVARRRIRMTTDVPMQELWLAIGNCGRPPQDRSVGFALYAIVLAIVAWIAVPFLFYLIVDRV